MHPSFRRCRLEAGTPSGASACTLRPVNGQAVINRNIPLPVPILLHSLPVDPFLLFKHKQSLLELGIYGSCHPPHSPTAVSYIPIMQHAIKKADIYSLDFSFPRKPMKLTPPLKHGSVFHRRHHRSRRRGRDVQGGQEKASITQVLGTQRNPAATRQDKTSVSPGERFVASPDPTADHLQPLVNGSALGQQPGGDASPSSVHWSERIE